MRVARALPGGAPASDRGYATHGPVLRASARLERTYSVVLAALPIVCSRLRGSLALAPHARGW